ncbi:MAG: hypothetical protein LBH84_09375 [Prevotellaceae bacterium]|nr:hypothetical protein [Prevotellaceae bacterium]
MKKTIILFIASAVAFSVAAERPNEENAKGKKDANEWQGMVIADSTIERLWQQQILEQGAIARRQGMIAADSTIERLWQQQVLKQGAIARRQGMIAADSATIERWKQQVFEQGAIARRQSMIAADSAIIERWKKQQLLAQNGGVFVRPGVAPVDSAVKQQRRKQRQEQMQARKIAYFTAQLELTPDEAERFWPVYNEYWKKRDDLFSERNKLIRKAKHDKMDDKKASQTVQLLMDNLQNDVSLMREYREKFAGVLSPQKLLKYYVAEESFKVELLKVLRKHGNKVEN